MNIKRNSYLVLGLVMGVSVTLYIFDVPMNIPSSQTTPTIAFPTSISVPVPTIQHGNISNIMKKYSATIDYYPEGKNESINVSLTLRDLIIIDVTSVHSMNNGKSRIYQTGFEAEIQPIVVGKNINTLDLSRIAGASFTTDAFLQAVKKIKNSI